MVTGDSRLKTDAGWTSAVYGVFHKGAEERVLRTMTSEEECRTGVSWITRVSLDGATTTRSTSPKPI
jgi:hypothetical protein